MHIKLFDLENYTRGQLKVTKIKPIYDFLLMFNSNYLSNLLCFQVIAIRRCTYSYLTFKITFNVKFKANKMKPIYDFLLLFNCNYLPNLHCFPVLAIRRCSFSHMTLKIAQGQIQGHRHEANI